MTVCILGLLLEYEASFKLDERLEVEKLCKLLVHKVDNLVQLIAHMVQTIVVGQHTIVRVYDDLGTCKSECACMVMGRGHK